MMISTDFLSNRSIEASVSDPDAKWVVHKTSIRTQTSGVGKHNKQLQRLSGIKEFKPWPPAFSKITEKIGDMISCDGLPVLCQEDAPL